MPKPFKTQRPTKGTKKTPWYRCYCFLSSSSDIVQTVRDGILHAQDFRRRVKGVQRSRASVGGLQDTEADTSDLEQTATYFPSDDDTRDVEQRQIRVRRGQQKFRDKLRVRYKGQCPVTGCKILALLEAAHISPYRGEKDNPSENGLLLRADIHTLFDLNLLGIEPGNVGDLFASID